MHFRDSYTSGPLVVSYAQIMSVESKGKGTSLEVIGHQDSHTTGTQAIPMIFCYYLAAISMKTTRGHFLEKSKSSSDLKHGKDNLCQSD